MRNDHWLKTNRIETLLSRGRKENTEKSRSLIIRSPFPFSAKSVTSSALPLREKAVSESKRSDSPPEQGRLPRNKGEV